MLDIFPEPPDNDEAVQFVSLSPVNTVGNLNSLQISYLTFGQICALLYRTGLPPNTATPSALFGGSLRREESYTEALFLRSELSC